MHFLDQELNMKHVFLLALIATLPLVGLAQEQVPQQDGPVQAPMAAPAANVPVGDQGYYGQVDLANNAPPPVIYSTPVVVQPAPQGAYHPPVYLRVPPGYYQNWPQYCGFYNACYYPVFFVQDVWYLNVYAPWYRRYYPYGRPGFVASVYFNPHYGGYRGGYGYTPRGYGPRREFEQRR